MRRTKPLTTSIAALLWLLAFGIPSAEAARGRCILGGPQSPGCTLWNGEGHALPLASRSEWALNASYNRLAQQAAAQQLGIWNSFYCGPGPEQLANLRVWVNANPPGADADDPNGEWARVRNLDPTRTV